jgi:hypothetical protein
MNDDHNVQMFGPYEAAGSAAGCAGFSVASV